MAEPSIVTVRTLLTHFRSTLQTARQTGEPVIIALRRRTPAGVLLGYETWQAGQAELAAVRQRVAELEAQLARPQPTGEAGATWGIAPSPEASASCLRHGRACRGASRRRSRQLNPGGANRERQRRGP